MADQESLGVLLSKIAVDLSDLKKGLQEGRSEMQSYKSMAQDVGQSVKSALAFTAGALGIYEIGSAIKSAFKQGIEAINQYQLTTIGVAATIADMAKDQTKGQQNYSQALAYSKEMYNELELAAARHFASGKELVEGWNIMAQKGVVLRKEEIDYLGIIVDRIKLATQGQVASMQIAQELRSILSGQARATDQVAMLLKDRLGPEWKKVVDQVRETGSLKPLADVFQGLAYANKDIQNSLEAQRTTLATLLTQVGRSGLQKAYEDIVGWLQQANDYLTTHREELAGKIAQAWDNIRPLAEAVVAAMSRMVLLALDLATYLTPLSNLMMDFTAAVRQTTVFFYGLFQAIEAGAAAAKQVLMDSCGTDVVGAFNAGMNAMKQSLQDWKNTAVQSANEVRWNIMNAGQARTKMHIPFMGGEPNYGQPEKNAADANLPPLNKPTIPTDTGKSAKEKSDNLLSPYLAMLKAKRDAELQDAKNSLDLLKETDALKKAELERALAAQEIDGQTYYQRLQELQQQEIAAALAIIEKKRQAQQKAYQDSLIQLNADQKLSPEAKDIARQKLEAENHKALLVLDAEAAKARLDGEVKVTNELKRQAEIKQQYQQKTEDLNLETAQLLGAVSEQEATLQKLYLDWQRAKQDAIRAGAPAEYLQALEKNYQAKRSDSRYGGYASVLADGLSSMANDLMSGGQGLVQAAHNVFKALFDEALKPGLESLKNTLKSGFKTVFGESAGAISSAVMGAVAMIGMLLTSSKGSSSWSSSGVTSAVTSHEAVRGIIAGETSIPIAQIGTGLQDALVPTNGILSQIEANTRGGGRGGDGGTLIQINAVNFDVLKEWLDKYFQDYLMQGAH